MAAAVMPEPMMTMSADVGRVGEWMEVRDGWRGWVCQKERVGLGIGRPGERAMRARMLEKSALMSERALVMAAML